MVRAANYATTTGKIAVDGISAPASTLCDLTAGHPLKSRHDCQTPYVVAWAIPFHSLPVPTIRDVACRATLWRSDLRGINCEAYGSKQKSPFMVYFIVR
jgi:hypothetical protein